jgi:hypothetical protein
MRSPAGEGGARWRRCIGGANLSGARILDRIQEKRVSLDDAAQPPRAQYAEITRRFAVASAAVVLLAACGAARSVKQAAQPPVAASNIDTIGAASAAAGTLPHDTLVVDSRVLHEARLINVYLPHGYREATHRFAVLYMPDGGMDEDFPHIVRAVDALVARNAIPPIIVVGIPNTQRRRDLTGPTRVASDSAIAPHVGGSAAFRSFIRDELIPVIDRRYRTTSERAIVGESLAGLFIVDTFLHEPALFDRYVAFDPSLWWNRGSLVDSTASLIAEMAKSAGSEKLFVASSRDDIDSETTRFASALRHSAPARLDWKFEPHPELTHATIFAALEKAGLEFALR